MTSRAAQVDFAKIASLFTLFLVSGVGVLYLHSMPTLEPNVTTHSFSSDFNSTASPSWNIGDLERVQMLFENTQRYQLDTEEGGREWESLVPEDGGIIYQRDKETGELGEYTISMFHQLRCLNVLRLELIRPTRLEAYPPNEPIVKHCLNYIRQMILCRSDLYLENVRSPSGPHTVDVTHVKTCKDWRKVYAATENQQEQGLRLF